ncbi:MAG: hypothetical protein EBX40_02960 [Gammaproteobacteria bacterium]|nr:hypothetical protein [Gammaproteobacteria bacterium]
MYDFEELEEMDDLGARRRSGRIPQVGAKGIRIKGYNVTTITGTIERVISQPGNMRNLIGLNVYVLTTGGLINSQGVGGILLNLVFYYSPYAPQK